MTSDRRLRERWRLCIPLCLPALVVLAGCGGKGDAPRFDLSGTVTYDGKPVPAGYIVFEPETAAGNSGPASQADIHDGKYSTLPGHGTIGGPHVVRIFGFDGRPYKAGEGPQGHPMLNPMGKPLFTASAIKVDLPKQKAVHDFAIPKQ
jgi:hypothetical protein